MCSVFFLDDDNRLNDVYVILVITFCENASVKLAKNMCIRSCFFFFLSFKMPLLFRFALLNAHIMGVCVLLQRLNNTHSNTLLSAVVSSIHRIFTL